MVATGDPPRNGKPEKYGDVPAELGLKILIIPPPGNYLEIFRGKLLVVILPGNADDYDYVCVCDNHILLMINLLFFYHC